MWSRHSEENQPYKKEWTPWDISIFQKNEELNRDVDQGLKTRFNIYSFRSLKNLDLNGKQRCFEEAPLIILYLALASNNFTLEYANSIKNVKVLLNDYNKSKAASNIAFKSDAYNFSHDGEYVRHKIRFHVQCFK